MQIEALKKVKQFNDNKKIVTDNDLSKTLKGVLINNHYKTQDESNNISFDDIADSLLINNNLEEKVLTNEKSSNESSFNVAKAIIPLLAGTAALAAGCFGISAVMKKSSQTLLGSKNFEQLPDIAVNMNIKEEPQFAIYRAIRDPNFKNIMGAMGIFIMSGITICCKNFIKGAKEVWLKKQSADIEKELQENLIEVETNSFSGKLNVVNDLMSKNLKLFEAVLNKSEKPITPPIFSGIASFKGKTKNTEEIVNISKTESTEKNEKRKKNIKYLALIGGVLVGAIALGKLSLSNLSKTVQNSSKFADNYTEKTIDAIQTLSEKADKKDIPRVTELLQSICAKPEFVKEIGQKYNLGEVDVQNIINSVEESKKTIFADAPTALGGIPKKIQYYCYIDENRGHLYNWILNPDNKFTKYIFLAFTISSSIGYLFKEGMDAIKDVTVMKENAKTELDLRKRLVDVEIKNFRAKKESAINPLTENFVKQANEGKKSKEELKQIADNILSETKNGPPYVYT